MSDDKKAEMERMKVDPLFALDILTTRIIEAIRCKNPKASLGGIEEMVQDLRVVFGLDKK